MLYSLQKLYDKYRFIYNKDVSNDCILSVISYAYCKKAAGVSMKCDTWPNSAFPRKNVSVSSFILKDRNKMLYNSSENRVLL